MFKTAVFFASALALLSACGGGTKIDYSQSGPSKTSTSTADPNAIPEKSTTANPVLPPNTDIAGKHPSGAAAPTETVQLTEYAIQMPDTLPSGTSTLNIANAGKEAHGFMIQGPGYEAGLPEPLMRGDTRELTVMLKPGTYNVWCPVDGHKGKGMQRTETVR